MARLSAASTSNSANEFTNLSRHKSSERFWQVRVTLFNPYPANVENMVSP